MCTRTTSFGESDPSGNRHRMISKFTFPIPVLFGLGAAECLREELAIRGIRRPMVVSSRRMADSPALKRILRGMPGCKLFTGLDSDPSEQNVMDGAENFVMEGCDGLVAAGCRSVIDATKAIRLKVYHPLPISEYGESGAGGEQITEEMPPCIAVPTGSGRGSEVDGWAVIRESKLNGLLTLHSEHLRPTSAVVDPELGIEATAMETAAGGMEALARNIESYLSSTFHPICDAIALEGARTAYQHLPAAVTNGRNLEARTGMAMASLMAGIGSQKGNGTVWPSAMAMLGGMRISHGAAFGLLLPHLIGRQEEEAPRLQLLLRHLGIGDFGAAWKELSHRIGMETQLRKLGVEEQALPALARAAAEVAERSTPKAPGVEEYTALFRAAW